jgi:hypothetical protein
MERNRLIYFHIPPVIIIDLRRDLTFSECRQLLNFAPALCPFQLDRARRSAGRRPEPCFPTPHPKVNTPHDTFTAVRFVLANSKAHSIVNMFNSYPGYKPRKVPNNFKGITSQPDSFCRLFAGRISKTLGKRTAEIGSCNKFAGSLSRVQQMRMVNYRTHQSLSTVGMVRARPGWVPPARQSFSTRRTGYNYRTLEFGNGTVPATSNGTIAAITKEAILRLPSKLMEPRALAARTSTPSRSQILPTLPLRIPFRSQFGHHQRHLFNGKDMASALDAVLSTPGLFSLATCRCRAASPTAL